MSEVADHFREKVRGGLDAERQELLVAAPDSAGARELRETLHLADRAVRQWAARATAFERPGHTSAYQLLDPLRPELGHAVQKAAGSEQNKGLDAKRELIAQMVWGIGERLVGVDAEASPGGLQHSLNQMAIEAGEILLAAGQVLADPVWVIEEANDALRELAGIR